MPPVTTRQTPGVRVNSQAPPPSVLEQAIPVSEIQDEFIKIVIYGQNRVGKTTLACQFPKPLLLIAFEPNRTGGALSVVKINGVTFLRVTSNKQAQILAQELGRSNASNWAWENEMWRPLKKENGAPLFEGVPFKTHVVDSATSYQDIILQEILNLPAIPEQLNWGMVSQDQYRERSEKTREALRPFLNLPAHTVVLAKERDHNPPKEPDKKGNMRVVGNKLIRPLSVGQESFLASDLGAGTAQWLHDTCDYIARMYLDKEYEIKEHKVGNNVTKIPYETGRIIHRLRTLYHPNCAAGFRSATPDKVPEYIDEPTYEKILAVIRGE